VSLSSVVIFSKPEGEAIFDVNLTNITALIGGELRRYDLRALYHIHKIYEEKRRRLQRMTKHKPKTAKRLLEKYSRRELNRARDFLQKPTTKIAREPREEAGSHPGESEGDKREDSE